MKKLKSFMCLFLFLCGGVLFAQNLLSNGDFENNTNDWVKESWGTVTFSYDATGGRSGSGAAKTSSLTEDNDCFYSQPMPGLVPGAEYVLNGYIKGNNITGGYGINIGYFVQNSDYQNSEGYLGTFDWTFVALRFTAGANGKVILRLGNWGQESTGEVWFDDIKLEQVGKKFLIVIGSELEMTGSLNLHDYQQDLLNQGWQSTMIYVNDEFDPGDTVSTHVCTDEVALKEVIRGYYFDGYNGFVIIGSPEDIPTAYWTFHKEYRTGGVRDYNPSDLYYADIDEWVNIDSEIHADGMPVYENFDSILDTGTGEWDYNYSSPANPDNEYYVPEMFFGRITAGTETETKVEEAQLISDYFQKIHDYRQYGSSLSSIQQDRGLLFANEGYLRGSTHGDVLRPLVSTIHTVSDHEPSTPTRFKEMLEDGYAYVQSISHAGRESIALNVWADGTEYQEGFDLDLLSTTNPKVHYFNLFNCNTGRFIEKNLATALLLNNDYTLNVFACTGSWGPWPSFSYGEDLNSGLEVGIAAKNFLIDAHTTHLNKLYRALYIMFGDPLVTYNSIQGSDYAPYVDTDLLWVEASLGKDIDLTISGSDVEDSSVTISMPGLQSILPNASYSNATNKLTWIPTESQVEQEYVLQIKVEDSVGNSDTEWFSIYASRFENAILNENTAGWDRMNPNISLVKKDRDSFPYQVEHYHLRTNSTNDWQAIEQTITVEAGKKNLFNWYIKNQLDVNPGNAYIHIPQIPLDIPVSSVNQPDFVYEGFVIPSGSNTELTFEFHSGDDTHPTEGDIAFMGMRTRDITGESSLLNGDFENGKVKWYAQKWGDPILKIEAGSGIAASSAAMISSIVQDNDCYWYQPVYLEDGTDYILSGQVKVDNIVGIKGVRAEYLSDNEFEETIPYSGTADWQPFSLEFTAESMGEIRLHFGSFGNETIGTAWFDNISLVEKNPTPTSGAISILYQNMKTNTASNELKFFLKVENTGTNAINLEDVTIRYWYTKDSSQTQNYSCDWAYFGIQNINGSIVNAPNPTSDADTYVEVSFNSGAGYIGAGYDSGEMQFRVWNQDWSNYNQANDYSFDPNITSYNDNVKMTAYINGVLAFGSEP